MTTTTFLLIAAHVAASWSAFMLTRALHHEGKIFKIDNELKGAVAFFGCIIPFVNLGVIVTFMILWLTTEGRETPSWARSRFFKRIFK